MTVVKVDSSNPENYKPFEFKLLPKGAFNFEVANDLVVQQAKTSSNKIIKVELRCTDEGENRGIAVFHNIVLTPKKEKELVHLALSCGTQKAEDIQQNGVDLSLMKGRICRAEVDVQPATTGEDGTSYRAKNTLFRFLFDAQG